MRVLDRGAARIGRTVIAGSRGWEIPASAFYVEERDGPLLAREAHRLQLALDEARGLRQEGDALVVMVHYPPVRLVDGALTGSVLWDTIGPARPDVVIHGHMHGPDLANAVDGPVDGIMVHCVSADHVRFAPRLILGGWSPEVGPARIGAWRRFRSRPASSLQTPASHCARGKRGRAASGRGVPATSAGGVLQR